MSMKFPSLHKGDLGEQRARIAPLLTGEDLGGYLRGMRRGLAGASVFLHGGGLAPPARRRLRG